MLNDTGSHYLVGYYTTHQPDGTHIEAHCTCGEKLEGVGQNESAVMSVHFDVEISHACGGVYEPNSKRHTWGCSERSLNWPDFLISVRFKKLDQKKHAEHDPTPLLQRDRRIMEAITELRVKLGADRVAIHQFHNGQVFSSGRPIWRISCTHETCVPGIVYRASEQRALIASDVIDLILPFFGHNVEGIYNPAVTGAGHASGISSIARLNRCRQGRRKPCFNPRGSTSKSAQRSIWTDLL